MFRIFHLNFNCSTPKSSRSCKKIRSAQIYAPLPPKFPISSCKTTNRTYETSQLLLEACEVLLEAKNSLRNVIKEFNNVISERDELGIRNYDIFKEETNVSVRFVCLNSKTNYVFIKKQIKREDFSSLPSKCLAKVCAENMKLWSTFLTSMTSKTIIQQHLSKKHHNLRVKRFSELFFLVRNPRNSALECGGNYQNYLFVAELARR